MRYAAFLRGVNVGGHRPLKMADVRAAFERMGFGNVRTVLASGNVVFYGGGHDPEKGDLAELTARIESDLERVLGYPITVALDFAAIAACLACAIVVPVVSVQLHGTNAAGAGAARTLAAPALRPS